jgi:hypothetical protein
VKHTRTFHSFGRGWEKQLTLKSPEQSPKLGVVICWLNGLYTKKITTGMTTGIHIGILNVSGSFSFYNDVCVVRG